MASHLIVSCSPYYEGWEAFGPSLTGEYAKWVFYDDRPIYFWEKILSRAHIRMLRASFQAVLRVSRGNAKLLITHDPRATFCCGMLCRLLGVRVNHYVNSFNFPELPTGIRLRLMRFAFQQVTRFAVHSRLEQNVYTQYFALQRERVHLRLWSIDTPKIYPASPLQEGRYVSAIGGNGRDYRTLLGACRLLGEVQFVVVVRPDSLEGLDIPSNVRVLTNIPFEEAMNILAHSEFTVVPLASATVPCGHVTLVCAMHLGRTVVATESDGISDYVVPGFNGILCGASSPESMARAIDRLWRDSPEVARLSENNRRFGASNCSENRLRLDVTSVLVDAGVAMQSRSPHSEDLVIDDTGSHPAT